MGALLLERHPWETSGASHQIQIPKKAFKRFFGAPGATKVHVWAPRTAPTSKKRSILLSYYDQSDTFRFNWLSEFGTLGHAVVVFEESGDPLRPYNVWWFTGADAAKVLALPYKWQQAKASQYGPGRKWAIISTPAPRKLTTK
jgi:hypothetical protein